MVTLVFFTLIFLMVGGWMTSWLGHERTLALHQEHIQCVYLLDSGVAWAARRLAEDPLWPGGHLTVPAGRIEVKVTTRTVERQELYVTAWTTQSSAAVQVWLDNDGQLRLWHEVRPGLK